MKLGKIILLNMLFALLLSIGVNAAGKNMVDDAKVLKQDTINTMEENLSKIEKNTNVTVKFDIVKSLNGKSIDDYSKKYAKDNISGDQYILFVTSVDDQKNKILVGDKANNILSKADVDNIVSLPNQDYKSNNFDAGIIKVGKAIDEKVTTKAVKVGNAEVVNNGYSTKIEHKTNYFGIFMIILIILIIGMILFVFIKRKINDDYEKRKRKFAQDNNLDPDDNSFRSANVNTNDRREHSSYNDEPNYYSSNTNSNTNSRMYDNSHVPNNSTINNTTIIHENNDNKFVEGMVVGSILSNSHDHHHHHYEDDDYRRSPERPYNNEYGRETDNSYNNNNESTTYTSGDWDNNTSSWGSDSSSDSSSSWDSNSSWDSGSNSSSSSDSGSSDW